MTTSRKAAISLLIAVLLFGVFSFLAFTGLFDLLQARFYNPSVTARLNRDNERNAEAIDKFFTETRERFSETLKTDTVRRSFLSYQRADDVSARSGIFNRLIGSSYGVQWVRFIDADGQRLFFSSYGPDILNSDETFPIYKDYDEPDLPYEIIAVPEDGTPKYTFDERAGRVIFSFPLYDSFDIYWGTALFSLSVDAVSTRLISEGRIKPGEDITVNSNPPGLLFGSAPGLDQASVLISTETSHGFFVGRLVNEKVFLLPTIMKVLLLLAFFLTAYLIIFLLFNLRQDPLVVVQNRLKQLQISLIEQFYERKGEADWARWIHELEQRREEVRALLKRGIKTYSRDNITGKSADMDILINRSWDELLEMLGSRRNPAIPGESSIASSTDKSVEKTLDEEKIAQVLQKLLDARTGAISSASPPVAYKVQPSSESAADGAGKTGLLNKASALSALITNEKEDIGLEDKIEILEELEEAEDLEKTVATDLSVEDGSIAPPPVSHTEIDKLANQIEFSPDIKTKTADEELFNDELEIVSPFSTMVFDLSPADDTKASEEGPSEENRDDDAYLDNNAAEGLPLITTPFSDISSRAAIETLETLNTTKEENTKSEGNIIEEREGVHYISEDVLTPPPKFAATLNPDFKELVDSVTK